nr:hypothetical protein [Gordonia sp. NB41Y]
MSDDQRRPTRFRPPGEDLGPPLLHHHRNAVEDDPVGIDRVHQSGQIGSRHRTDAGVPVAEVHHDRAHHRGYFRG